MFPTTPPRNRLQITVCLHFHQDSTLGPSSIALEIDSGVRSIKSQPTFPLLPSENFPPCVQVYTVRTGNVLDAGRRRKHCTGCRRCHQGEPNLLIVVGVDLQLGNQAAGRVRPCSTHPLVPCCLPPPSSVLWPHNMCDVWPSIATDFFRVDRTSSSASRSMSAFCPCSSSSTGECHQYCRRLWKFAIGCSRRDSAKNLVAEEPILYRTRWPFRRTSSLTDLKKARYYW